MADPTDYRRMFELEQAAHQVCAEQVEKWTQGYENLAQNLSDCIEENIRLREILGKAPRPNVKDDSWIVTYMDWWFQERLGALPRD
jgi:hypothetical protein